MPGYAESDITDRELIDLATYFDGLPSVAEPGPWRRQVPMGAPRGLAVATTAGCVQCHHPLFNNGRGVMGGISAKSGCTDSKPRRAASGRPPLCLLVARLA